MSNDSPSIAEPGDSVLILGIGNLLWADEGFGVRAVQVLNSRYRFGPQVTIMDGGTQGLYLIQHVQAADVLVVFDAVDYGLAPGEMKVVEGDAVPAFMGAKKMSLHQSGFQEVLSTVKLTGDYPRELLLVGVQPVVLDDYGGSLRPAVRAQIDPAIQVALNWLAQRGIHAHQERCQAEDPAEMISSPALSLTRYESDRPDASVACRVGDERVLRNKSIRYDPKPSLIEGDALSVNVDNRRAD